MNTKRDYSEYCANGFLLTKKQVSLTWDKEILDDYVFYYEKSLTYNICSEGNKTVIVIGEALDIRGDVDNPIERIFQEFQVSYENALKYIAYLAGRYLVILKEGNRIYIIPDSHCTYACYWCEYLPSTFASHLQLFKDFFGVNKNEVLSYIMNHQDYISPGGKYFPATLTPLFGVHPLIANCFIMADDTYTEHKRFYPFVSLKDKYGHLTKDEIYFMFKGYMLNYFRHIHNKYKGNIYISLTNGLDSRAVLAVSLLCNLKVNTFTYTKFGGSYQHYERDLVGASKCATHAGFPHFVLFLPELNYGNQFYEMYSKSFSLHARFPVLTQAYYEQLPVGINVLISTISETGTVFYSVRDRMDISPEVLSEKWSTSKINQHEIVLREFENYIDYTEFYADKIFDFDFYDLFYWEHRNSKWANIWYQECDLSHNVVLPFNCRLINELMLAMPFEERKNKYLLKRLIRESGLSDLEDFYA